MSEHRIVGALALAWACIIFVASSIPARQMPDMGPLMMHDKLMHAGAYAPLGALSLLVIRTRCARLPTLLMILLSGLIAGVYGITDEFHQSFVPGRSVEGLDVAADFIGGSLGAAATFVLTKLLGPQQSGRPPTQRGEAQPR